VHSGLPGCSVIIIAYNSGSLLPSCLHSIQNALAGMEHQILVLDNGSPEPLREEMPSHFPGVEFIHSSVNMGFGKACNAAAGKAVHPYLFFVNPDTLVSSDTFRSTLEYIVAKPNAGIVGCRILNGDGTIQWACRRNIPTPMAAIYKTLGLAALFPKSRRFGAYNLTYLDPDQEAEVEAISGSFFCVARNTYIQVKGFDESFFMYGEDLDICVRVRQAGYQNFYFPGTSIVHFKGQSSKTRALMSYVNFYQAMLIFVRKHRHFRMPVGVVALGILLAALIGVFSRLLPRWWKMLLDLACVGAGWGIVGLSQSWQAPKDALFALMLMAWIPLLVQGEYSTHRLDSRHLARTLVPALVAGSLLSYFGLGADPLVFPAAGLGLVFLLAWRRVYHWGTYFFRVFTGRRCRAVLLGSSPEVSHWFADENLLPGRELLGCVTQIPEQADPAQRVHVLGSPGELTQIRLRTGCRELLVVPDSWGRHEPVVAQEIWKTLKMKTSLLIGHPDTGTFMLVDLNYLK